MKDLLVGLIKAYTASCAYLVALLLIVTAALLGSKALTVERIKAAVLVLRTPKEKAAEPNAVSAVRPEGPADPEAVAARERLVEMKAAELRKLEDRVATQLGQLQAEQAALEKKRQEQQAALDEIRKARAQAARAESSNGPAGTDSDLAANLPIISKMEAAGIVALMQGWDDARFVRYLRALKPGKAAEVLETIRTDPQFDAAFRTVPPNAPPGTKTRAERINEEFTKAP